ncbi:histidine phosphatase family protein [Brevibacillus ginsengisoli]|uniref:histidine phosphatase family protein n=1 Tax=Brevibacillus ginsengisoli TaxID=363854 RepID=UPI003CF867B6
MRLILLRHGETNWNRERRIQGQLDIPLNEAGVLQMSKSSDHFADRQIHFARILSSPLLRAKQSAEICGRRLSVLVEEAPSFRERAFGDLEGVTIEEIVRRYGIDCEEIVDSRYGVESQEDVLARISMGFDEIFERFADQNILLITHGSIIKLFAKQYGVDVGIMRNGTYLELYRNKVTVELLNHHLMTGWGEMLRT